MKNLRVNLILTFSAALAGLLLGVTSPSAFGHGNNPSYSDLGPDTLDISGGGGGPEQSSRNERLIDVLTPDPDVNVFVGADLFDALDVSSQVMVDRPAVAPGSGAARSPGAGPAADIGVNAFQTLPGSSAVRGLAGAIPAPGTLALLGLAAAAARRRRRR